MVAMSAGYLINIEDLKSLNANVSISDEELESVVGGGLKIPFLTATLPFVCSLSVA